MANSGGVYTWSRTATTNATADSTVNYAEGQAPSSLNDSARNAMASVAKWRDDIAGAIVTTGLSTGYIVSSYQQFDSLAHMDGQVIAFTPHTTNTGNQAFLNVDSLGSKTVRSASGIDVPAGTLIQGTPYEAVYNNSDGVFYLKGFYGSPYVLPIGSTVEWWSNTLPNSSFIFPCGQAISRTTYAALFAIFATGYGAGDGSTTFNVPDLRGRATVTQDLVPGFSDSGRLTGGTLNARSLGGFGGEATHTLTASEIPSITSTASTSGTLTGSTSNVVTGTITDFLAAGGNPILKPANSGSAASVSVSGTLTGSATSNNTSGSSHNNLPPTILCNRIMRVL